MPFPEGHYDAETLALMQRALDAAWKEAGASAAFGPIVSRGPVGIMMAIKIMAAVKQGERDPDTLKRAALTAVERPKLDGEG